MPDQNEDHLEHPIIAILSAITKKGVNDIQLKDSLVEDLGLDSIQFLEMLAELEDKFDFELDVDDLRPELFRTVRAVVHFVKAQVIA